MESLGRNCEFGLVQRRLGLEPIGLLRWAGMNRDNLLRGLKCNWVGLGTDITVERVAHDDREMPEWILVDRTYGMTFHLGNYKRDAAPQLARQAAPRLRRLADKLMEDISEGSKILVYSSADLATPDEAFDLLAAVRDIGAAPMVLVAEGAPSLYHMEHLASDLRTSEYFRLGYAAGADMDAWFRLLSELETCI